MKAYRLNIDQVEIFFQICHELNATSEESRTLILEVMAEKGLVDGITQTSMTKDEYVKHLSKHFTCAIVKNSSDNAQQEE